MVGGKYAPGIRRYASRPCGGGGGTGGPDGPYGITLGGSATPVKNITFFVISVHVTLET